MVFDSSFLDSGLIRRHNIGVGQSGESLRGQGRPRKHSCMLEFLTTPTAQIVLGLAGIAALVAVGIYIIARVRTEWIESKPETNDLIINFRQLRESGELSDQEYRTIKGMLADKLVRELNDSGEKR